MSSPFGRAPWSGSESRGTAARRSCRAAARIRKIGLLLVGARYSAVYALGFGMAFGINRETARILLQSAAVMYSPWTTGIPPNSSVWSCHSWRSFSYVLHHDGYDSYRSIDRTN